MQNEPDKDVELNPPVIHADDRCGLRLMPADVAYRSAVDRGEIDPDSVPSWQDGYAFGQRLLSVEPAKAG